MPSWFWRMCGFGHWQDKLIRNTRLAEQNRILKIVFYELPCLCGSPKCPMHDLMVAIKGEQK